MQPQDVGDLQGCQKDIGKNWMLLLLQECPQRINMCCYSKKMKKGKLNWPSWVQD